MKPGEKLLYILNSAIHLTAKNLEQRSRNQKLDPEFYRRTQSAQRYSEQCSPLRSLRAPVRVCLMEQESSQAARILRLSSTKKQRLDLPRVAFSLCDLCVLWG